VFAVSGAARPIATGFAAGNRAGLADGVRLPTANISAADAVLLSCSVFSQAR
jgi:hypothetical protein